MSTKQVIIRRMSIRRGTERQGQASWSLARRWRDPVSRDSDRISWVDTVLYTIRCRAQWSERSGCSFKWTVGTCGWSWMMVRYRYHVESESTRDLVTLSSSGTMVQRTALFVDYWQQTSTKPQERMSHNSVLWARPLQTQMARLIHQYDIKIRFYSPRKTRTKINSKRKENRFRTSTVWSLFDTQMTTHWSARLSLVQRAVVRMIDLMQTVFKRKDPVSWIRMISLRIWKQVQIIPVNEEVGSSFIHHQVMLSASLIQAVFLSKEISHPHRECIDCLLWLSVKEWSWNGINFNSEDSRTHHEIIRCNSREGQTLTRINDKLFW